MTRNKSSTRYFSSAQEDYVAKLLGFKLQPNSGAARFSCGDIVGEDWLIEAKCHMTAKKSFAIKKEWLDKLERERMDLQKSHAALCFQFEPNGENYFIVKENLFKEMLDKDNRI